MTTSRPRLEEIWKYFPGGYHPVEIGEELHEGRYRILHRLGHGSFSTVWLALNNHHGTGSSHPFGTIPRPAPRSRYVAIKIFVGDMDDVKDERSIYRRLAPQEPIQDTCIGDNTGTASGSEFVVTMLDEFGIRGPNGFHRCVVTDVLGPTVAAVKECSELDAFPLPLEIARRATFQCAKGLAFLHSQGIVHGGMCLPHPHV